jgi:1,4-dihydroxy-6-naphthoate synthase
MGFGVGPLLLAAREGTRPDLERPGTGVTLCPGRYTTAALLFQMFYGNTTEIQHVVFSEIMPMLCANKADFGVCIHEGRFTWQRYGLSCIEDLGTRWEAETQCALPLGGILARRDLPLPVVDRVNRVIVDSLHYGLANRDQTLPTMRRHAQELSDEVLFRHVDLYVNQWTLDLGSDGRRALQTLSEMARLAGIVARHNRAIQVFELPVKLPPTE